MIEKPYDNLIITVLNPGKIMRNEMNPAKSSLIITGPTSSGKTSLALRYARFLKNNCGIGAEIVNADSAQLYSELKILTSHPSEEDLKQIGHSFYGILSPEEESSVAFWLKLVRDKIDRLRKENKAAILCGGTGFYISALLEGISPISPIPSDFRREVLKRFQEMGGGAFFQELSKLDPISAKTLHRNNTQRVLRAYEVASYTGKPLSEWWKEKDGADHRIATVILLPPRDELNARCLSRIEQIMENGVIKEVENFTEKYSNYQGSLRKVIGYEAIIRLLKKEITKRECIDQMHTKTKQYIKRQLTWFRNQLPEVRIIPSFGDAVDPKTIFENQD